MAKYNVGDVLEITESFELEGAQYKAGQKYSVEDIFDVFYELEDVEAGLSFNNSRNLVDAHSGFRKVQPKVEFKRGDKVRLLEGAHGNSKFSWGTPEKFPQEYQHADLQGELTVTYGTDTEGEVHLEDSSGSAVYVLPEFLVPWVEEDPETEEKPSEHMELGKTYYNPKVGTNYTVTYIDFEAERVHFVFNGNQPTERRFVAIPEHFDGVLPPIKPAEALDKLREKLQAVEPEEAPKQVSAMISEDALREANRYLNSADYIALENIIALAKRLS